MMRTITAWPEVTAPISAEHCPCQGPVLLPHINMFTFLPPFLTSKSRKDKGLLSLTNKTPRLSNTLGHCDIDATDTGHSLGACHVLRSTLSSVNERVLCIIIMCLRSARWYRNHLLWLLPICAVGTWAFLQCFSSFDCHTLCLHSHTSQLAQSYFVFSFLCDILCVHLWCLEKRKVSFCVTVTRSKGLPDTFGESVFPYFWKGFSKEIKVWIRGLLIADWPS